MCDAHCLQLVMGCTLLLILTIRDAYDLINAAIVGDITPADGVPKSEKSRMEREALDHMCTLLGEPSRGILYNIQMSEMVSVS